MGRYMGLCLVLDWHFIVHESLRARWPATAPKCFFCISRCPSTRIGKKTSFGPVPPGSLHAPQTLKGLPAWDPFDIQARRVDLVSLGTHIGENGYGRWFAGQFPLPYVLSRLEERKPANKHNSPGCTSLNLVMLQPAGLAYEQRNRIPAAERKLFAVKLAVATKAVGGL